MTGSLISIIMMIHIWSPYIILMEKLARWQCPSPLPVFIVFLEYFWINDFHSLWPLGLVIWPSKITFYTTCTHPSLFFVFCMLHKINYVYLIRISYFSLWSYIYLNMIIFIFILCMCCMACAFGYRYVHAVAHVFRSTSNC